MHFCGRETELSQLISAWEAVSDLSNPGPLLAIIKAEQGIGKTRLALEFCRWLSMQYNPDGYWPEGLGVNGLNLIMNPDPHSCIYQQPIPFLWWGIRATDPNRENAAGLDAVASYDAALAPHLVALGARGRLLSSGKEVLNVWSDFVKGELANWSGYDSVMSAGESLFKTVGIVRGVVGKTTHQRSEVGVARSISRVDAVMEDLEKIFNPRSLGYARTPGVILIDDAHFMAFDPGLMSLTSRLLHQANSQSWPVLVIATHWKRELAKNFSEQGNGFGAILHHGMNADPHSNGPVAKIPGGYLNKDDIISVDLSPIEDLSSALLNSLPGLTTEQQNKLLHHAGGNPRHLQQIIAFLLEHEFLFEGDNTQSALTQEGLEEALTETQEIFGLVLKRLRSAPMEVQEAIFLASFQGFRFVSDIVNDVALMCLESDRMQALEQAHNPFSMVQHNDNQGVAEFSEQLFLRVAERQRRGLRVTGQTGPELALKEVLKSRLKDIGSDPSPSKATMLTLQLAVQQFSLRSPEEAILRLEALARLASMEVALNSHESALNTALRFSSDLATSGLAIQKLNRDLVANCADLLIEEGKTKEARSLLEPLLEFCRWAHEEQIIDALEFSKTLETAANLEETEGNFRLALQLLEEALQERKDSIKQSLNHDHALAVLYASIGWIEHQLGNTIQAQAAHRESVSLRRAFVNKSPGIKATRFLSMGIGALASVMDFESPFDDIAALEAERVDLCRELVACDPSDENLNALASAQQAFAGGPMGSYQDVEPEILWKMLIDVLDRRREYDSKLRIPSTRRDVASALKALAEYEFTNGTNQAALQYERESAEIMREISNRLQAYDSKQDLTSSLGLLAYIELNVGNHETALALLEECVVISREVAAQLRTWVADQMLCNYLHNLAHELDNQGQGDQAMDFWDEHNLVEARIASHNYED